MTFVGVNIKYLLCALFLWSIGQLDLKGQDQPTLPQGYSIRLSYDAYLLDHPISFNVGAGITLYKAVWQQRGHQIWLGARTSFVRRVDVESRWLLGPSIQYRLYLLRRLSLAADYQLLYQGRRFAYERAELNEAGVPILANRTSHSLRMGIDLSASYEIFQREQVNIGLEAELSFLQLDKNQPYQLFRGYTLIQSTGIFITF